jgi:hypothetical protein
MNAMSAKNGTFTALGSDGLKELNCFGSRIMLTMFAGQRAFSLFLEHPVNTALGKFKFAPTWPVHHHGLLQPARTTTQATSDCIY